jgi:hypothetical protein
MTFHISGRYIWHVRQREAKTYAKRLSQRFITPSILQGQTTQKRSIPVQHQRYSTIPPTLVPRGDYGGGATPPPTLLKKNIFFLLCSSTDSIPTLIDWHNSAQSMANPARKHGVNSQHHYGSYLLEVQKDDLHLEPPGPLCESDCALVRPKESDHLAPEPLHPP